MELAQFDYDLPAHLIAQQPHRPRDHSRLLVARREGGAFEHRRFYEIEEYLRPGDLLVMNNTRVIRARLLCQREPGGGRTELLLLRRNGDGNWEALVRPARAARVGVRLLAGKGAAEIEIIGGTSYGGRLVRFHGRQPDDGLLEEIGDVPTPPYIHARVDDSSDYQTVYAERDGSAAAPTAGFHFTPELLDRLRDLGIRQSFVTLHIGVDTFRPIKVNRLAEHVMHAEFYEVPIATAEAIAATRREGARVIAVGTTAVRALESAADDEGVHASHGWTRLFIRPGHRFRAPDALLTNFHLPRSTLLVMVSAFAGCERVRAAYGEAIQRSYRFYSFGDAMLIL